MKTSFNDWLFLPNRVFHDRTLLLIDKEGEVAFHGLCSYLHYNDKTVTIKNRQGCGMRFYIDSTISINYSYVYDTLDDLDDVMATVAERLTNDLKTHDRSITRFKERRDKILPREADYINDFVSGDKVYSYYPDGVNNYGKNEGVYYEHFFIESEVVDGGQTRFKIVDLDCYKENNFCWSYVYIGGTKDSAKYNYEVQDSKRYYEMVDFANKLNNVRKSLINLYVKTDQG
jgi:hypothetical protein